MSLITDSDDYSPGMHTDGTYIDHIPCFTNLPQGIRCPCNYHTFATRQSFLTHTKTLAHKRWLERLNANRTNYFVELEKERQVVHQQKIIIAKMELDIARLEREKQRILEMVHVLSDISTSVSTTSGTSTNLIDFINE